MPREKKAPAAKKTVTPRRSRSKGPADQPLPDVATAAAAAEATLGEGLAVGPQTTAEAAVTEVAAREIPQDLRDKAEEVALAVEAETT
eukprot:12821944-Alexandrium_andersonii.AAC.1